MMHGEVSVWSLESNQHRIINTHFSGYDCGNEILTCCQLGLQQVEKLAMSLALNGGEGGGGDECYILHRCVTSSNLR